MATALPAALGLKLSHFAGSSTARTGGSKIGTARKIHLVEASVQQSGRGAARRRGRIEKEGRGYCREGTLHSAPQAQPPLGQVLSAPTPHEHLHMPHIQAKALKSSQGPAGPSGQPGLLSQRHSQEACPPPFALLPIPSSQRAPPTGARWLPGIGDT